jgi:hypothetical protein
LAQAGEVDEPLFGTEAFHRPQENRAGVNAKR